jgi:hypothetical protein
VPICGTLHLDKYFCPSWYEFVLPRAKQISIVDDIHVDLISPYIDAEIVTLMKKTEGLEKIKTKTLALLFDPSHMDLSNLSLDSLKILQATNVTLPQSLKQLEVWGSPSIYFAYFIVENTKIERIVCESIAYGIEEVFKEFGVEVKIVS